MTDMMNMLMTNYYWVEVILAVGMAIYYGPKVFDKKVTNLRERSNGKDISLSYLFVQARKNQPPLWKKMLIIGGNCYV